MRPTTHRFLPLVALLAFLYGGGYVWLGVARLRGGESTRGLFDLLFGVVGIALAATLWRVRRRVPTPNGTR